GLPVPAGTGLHIGASGSSPNMGQIVFGDNSGWKLHFGTNVAGRFTERMTVVDSGNVGIGITTPAAKLDARDDTPSGVTRGLQGVVASPTGIGVVGYASATSGLNYGVIGQSDSLNGVAGYFLNNRGGDIIQGAATGGPIVFRVANNGSAFFNGTV